MGKLIWGGFAVFLLIATIKECGGIDGFIEPAKPKQKGAIMVCMDLNGYAEQSNCMARNCLYDEPNLNAPHCNVR